MFLTQWFLDGWWVGIEQNHGKILIATGLGIAHGILGAFPLGDRYPFHKLVVRKLAVDDVVIDVVIYPTDVVSNPTIARGLSTSAPG